MHIKDWGLDSYILFSFIFSVGFYGRFPEFMFSWDGAVKHLLPQRLSHWRLRQTDPHYDPLTVTLPTC